MRNDYVSTIEHKSIAWVNWMDEDPFIGGIIRGDASRDDYVWFLEATYHYLRWSGPLLAATAEGLRRGGRYPWLLARVSAKSKEEGTHDRWVLSDLERCGVNIELVKESAAPTAVDDYVQWSLTMAEEGSPGFLGAAYTLEFISMHRASMAAENLRARRVIPNIENAVSFLEGHGDADVNHVAQLNETLRRIEDPRDRGAIRRSASILRDLYPRFFQSGAPGGCRLGEAAGEARPRLVQ